MSYFKKTLSGIFWTGALRASLKASSVIRTIILAHLLSPSQFGIYGVATLTLALLETLTETGINVFLIQEADLEKYLDTAWLVSILRGLAICLVLVIAGPFISAFFKSPGSLMPIYLISLVALIRGFINPAEIVFQKHLRFDSEFKFRSSLFIIEAVVTITVAFLTRSVSSFIFGLMASALAEVILSYILIRPLPRFNLHPPHIHIILHRGKWITAAGIFNYLYQNLDNIVVGRLLGVGPLGLYSTAYSISSLPITEAADTLSKVTFPVFAQIQNDRRRLQMAFSKTAFTLLLLILPFGLILFFFPQIIVLVLGSKWAPATTALRFLSIYGVIRAFSGFASTLFLSLNKNNYVAYITLASIVGLSLTIVPFVSRWGIVGASLSAIIGSLATLPVIFFCFRSVFKP